MLKKSKSKKVCTSSALIYIYNGDSFTKNDLFVMSVIQMRTFLVLLVLSVLYHSERCFSGDDSLPLVLEYYKESCPSMEEIVRRQVEIAILKDPRMAASLLRMHFHDCFVLGCDASVLLDDFGGIVSEKSAGPNLNSLRGFEVIDEIKCLLEEACPCTVSCADMLAVIARDAVALRGGPSWDVYLGRRDSLVASLTGANQFIPAPNSTLQALVASFEQQGLDPGDLVALSGGHTIGKAKCSSFRQRIYGPYDSGVAREYEHQNRNFVTSLESICPESGGDDALEPLDYETPSRFDNYYFQSVKRGEGLLISDDVLVSQDMEGEIRERVWAYAADEELFFEAFRNSMIKMGNIHVLTGEQGQIRKNCRLINI